MSAGVLIVNADDFGMSSAITRGIVKAHTDGIVTSTSLMVRRAGAEEAAVAASRYPDLSVGLHLDLGEWECRNGDWHPLYEIVSLSDESALCSEIERQVERFVELVGGPPTHLDSHQHVHLDAGVASVVVDLGARLGVPVRRMTKGIRYCGDFYGQAEDGAPYLEGIAVDHLVEVLNAVAGNVMELACHPGMAPTEDDQYAQQRPLELAALTDERVRAAVRARGIDLVGFRDVAGRDFSYLAEEASNDA